eukprot:6196169-Pleurochrysis_carterae.AAC.1
MEGSGARMDEGVKGMPCRGIDRRALARRSAHAQAKNCTHGRTAVQTTCARVRVHMHARSPLGIQRACSNTRACKRAGCACGAYPRRSITVDCVDQLLRFEAAALFWVLWLLGYDHRCLPSESSVCLRRDRAPLTKSPSASMREAKQSVGVDVDVCSGSWPQMRQMHVRVGVDGEVEGMDYTLQHGFCSHSFAVHAARKAG